MRSAGLDLDGTDRQPAAWEIGNLHLLVSLDSQAVGNWESPPAGLSFLPEGLAAAAQMILSFLLPVPELDGGLSVRVGAQRLEQGLVGATCLFRIEDASVANLCA
jgi:hypothetical protein